MSVQNLLQYILTESVYTIQNIDISFHENTCICIVPVKK